MSLSDFKNTNQIVLLPSFELSAALLWFSAVATLVLDPSSLSRRLFPQLTPSHPLVSPQELSRV